MRSAPIHHTHVLIIGTGIAGLFTALKLADAGLAVCLVTKTSLAESNSRYAQGGIAAVLPQNLEDSLDLHVADTMRAGAGLCDAQVVRDILAQGAEAILDLLQYGVPFDTNAATQELALTQEAAHSVRRIIHAGGDATGQSVEMALIQQVHKHSLITVVEHCTVVSLWKHHERCTGAWGVLTDATAGNGAVSSALPPTDGPTMQGFAPNHVILATGGAGQLYQCTTNPPIATGDGIYLARQLGAELRDLEFVQFHPTAFFNRQTGQVQFLISEALRGEGAVLLNDAGERFIHHPDQELAPRDIVTRAIFAEQQRTGKPHVWLSLCHQPASLIEHRFPTILKLCLEEGVDIRREAIPVSPAAHYMMGGIAVDTEARTTVAGLYAVGEVACTGLHGANRLASNSLLECVVLARQAALSIAAAGTIRAVAGLTPPKPPDFTAGTSTAAVQTGMAMMKHRMWANVGIVRDTAHLNQALADLQALVTASAAWQWHWMPAAPLLGWHCHQMANLACWVVQAALKRETSIGAHYRLNDHPMPGDASGPGVTTYPHKTVCAIGDAT
jgi:L-aspartate oxidase